MEVSHIITLTISFVVELSSILFVLCMVVQNLPWDEYLQRHSTVVYRLLNNLAGDIKCYAC